MVMLAFMPWLDIKAPIVQGPFRLFPQGVGDAPPDGVASLISAETIAKLLSQYRESADFPLRVVSVLQYDGRPLGSEFDEADRADIFRFGQHLAVSGLSARRFIGGFPDGYTASGHYQVVIQAFTEPFTGSVSLTHRRKDGHASVMLGRSDLHFLRPAHLVSQGLPNINLRLLAALQSVQTLPQAPHEHVDASVTQYLLANSDSPDVPLEVESIATFAALERVTDSDHKLADIRRKLPSLLEVADGAPLAARLRDELGLPAVAQRPMLNSWLQQIYSLRGNVAHGNPASKVAQQWLQQDHLLAGAFIYPLALKCLLAQQGLYSLDEEDVAWALGIEALLTDRPFNLQPAQSQAAGTPAGDEDADFLPAPDLGQQNHWQLQFERINHALLDISLFQTVSDSLDAVEGPPTEDRMGNSSSDGGCPPGRLRC